MSVIASCPLRTPTLAHRLSLQNQQPKRRISNYLSDVLRTGSLNPSNPILETFETIYPKKTEQADETEASASETTTTTTAKSFHNRIPHFSVWQPHHLLDAAPKLENQYSDDVASFKAKLSDTSSTHSLKEIVSDWDRIHSPIKYVHNASFVLGLLSDASLHKDWKIALGEISKTLPNPMNEALLDQYEDKEILSLFYASLKEGMEKLDSNTNSNEDWMWAALHWKNVIRKRTGLGLTPDQRETFHTNLDAMDALEGRMVAHSNPSKEQLGQLLSDGYSILDLRKQNAKLLGYKDFVEQTLDSRMAKNAGEIQSLHETIADRVLPVVETVPYDPFDPQFFKPGEIHNVTFDGALTALSKLVYNLFGVEIRKEDQPKERDLAVWNKDVWLLHLIDHENKEEDGEPSYLGSIFLDPFKRPAKLRRSFLAPLVDRGFMNEPLVAISLEISPPVWDDQPAEMQWEDTETLWHEFGHALQTILAKSSLGRVCGGHNLPLDMSEVMPKVS